MTATIKMGVSSVKHLASLETYSKRVNKSKRVYQRRKELETNIQDESELLQRPVLPAPCSTYSQSDPLSIEPSLSLQRGRPTSRGTGSSLPPSKRLSESRKSRDLVHLSTTEQQLNSPAPSSPTSSKRVSEPPLVTCPPSSRTRFDESSSQYSTCSIPQRGSKSGFSKESMTLRDISILRPSKKRRYGSQTPSQDGLPPMKKLKQSITSYFRPLPRSSSPSATLSCHASSDTSKSSTTSPSSPAPSDHSLIVCARKSQKRRLTTKPSLPPIKMSSDVQYGGFEDDENTVSFTEAIGDMADENKIEFAEQALDREEAREEARDAIQSNRFGVPAHLADTGKRPASILSARIETTTSNPLMASRGDNESTQDQSTTSTGNPIAISDIPHQPIPIPQRKYSGFKQLYLDVHDGEEWIQCKECDRYYDASSQRSKAMHEIEHNKRLHAKVTKKEMSKSVLAKWIGDDKKHCVVVIDCRQSVAVRSHGQAVLGVTSEALGPIHVDKQELWCEIPDPQSTSFAPAQVPRFRIFVHYIDDDVVSVILAERIREGCGYHVGRTDRKDGGPLLGEGNSKWSLLDLELDIKRPVWVSIERIWVREGHRRRGYATQMVDFVRENFVHGLSLGKNQIAFSWPFASGISFATKYCHAVFADAPFLVNADEVRH